MTTNQRLRVMPRPYRLEFISSGALPADDDWTALVRAPEGLTVVRETSPAPDTWAGLYGLDAPDGLETAGMLAALLGPLAEAGISVCVVSTFHADLILVPYDRLSDATDTLRTAGHRIDH